MRRSRWEQADAEALPCDDASFDVVLSCLGVMFAPHHQRAADQLLRVCRPGGTIALLSWTPEGFIGRMFATMKPVRRAAAARRPAASALGQRAPRACAPRVTGSATCEPSSDRVSFDRFASGAEFRDYFKAFYGPTIATYKFIAETPSACAPLDAALAALG